MPPPPTGGQAGMAVANRRRSYLISAEAVLYHINKNSQTSTKLAIKGIHGDNFAPKRCFPLPNTPTSLLNYGGAAERRLFLAQQPLYFLPQPQGGEVIGKIGICCREFA